jgi:hypothetical protein
MQKTIFGSGLSAHSHRMAARLPQLLRLGGDGTDEAFNVSRNPSIAKARREKKKVPTKQKRRRRRKSREKNKQLY